MEYNFRKIIITSLLGIVLLGLAFMGAMKMKNSKKSPPEKEASAVPVNVVDVLKVQLGSVKNKIEVQGRLNAYKQIDIFSEVGGRLLKTGKPFKKGTKFVKGDILFSIDNEVQRLNLLSQKSNLLNGVTQIMPDLKIDYPESFEAWENYMNNFRVESKVIPLPTAKTSREKLFIANKNLLSQYYTIKGQEAQLEKYTVYAPFSGVLTEANINDGVIISPGQKLGTLMNVAAYELEAPISLIDLEQIRVGSKVSLISESIKGNWTGTVKRISDQIDRQTQSVTVYISVQGKSLRDGMYLKGTAVATSFNNSIEIPIACLNDKGEVYIVENDALKSIKVELIKSKSESVIVKGLPDGALVLIERLPSIFEGMKVKVGNVL